MTPTLSSPTPAHRRAASRPAHRQRAGKHRRGANGLDRLLDQRPLGRYIDPTGQTREVLSSPGAAGSVLVLDRDGTTHGDLRLVAHLGADEPAENAAVVCASYLADAACERCRCRAVTPEDIRSAPFAEEPPGAVDGRPSSSPEQPLAGGGYRYRLQAIPTGMSIPELRWCRRRHPTEAAVPVSVRDVIASLESYEPTRALTAGALSRHRTDDAISTAVLRAELTRIQESPIVLNRRLREVVLQLVRRDQLSMSEIAIRCGRIKRDRKGKESGETSWLARRLGILPEGGHSTPTPWIHSDVLALIARNGLDISPREVEL